jgi:hypothetical protein
LGNQAHDRAGISRSEHDRTIADGLGCYRRSLSFKNLEIDALVFKQASIHREVPDGVIAATDEVEPEGNFLERLGRRGDWEKCKCQKGDQAS